MIYASCTAEPLGSPKLVHPEKRDVKNVRRDIEKLQGDGWCPQYEGLLAAAAFAFDLSSATGLSDKTVILSLAAGMVFLVGLLADAIARRGG